MPRISRFLAAALAAELETLTSSEGGQVPDVLISDHPMWLADAVDRGAIALPDEDLDAVLELSQLFAAPWVVVVGERGRYPEALLEARARPCLAADPRQLSAATGDAWLFRLGGGCPST